MCLLTSVFTSCNISNTMNTVTGYTRLNITVPKNIVEYVRQNTSDVNKYISEAISERIANERREKAFEEILAGPPSFTEVGDSAKYMRKLRMGDEERMKRLDL
jgi:hypothetical protein